ncbi:aspartate/glutamate racemase family protein [Streptosporangium sp. NPDC023615]|uniref:aspartate/glutamate racemase family protein n=1 Tax=Streptosporangium sp. NPDC023615 TaxID=3154794 RepID=UPI0034391D65
MKAETETDAGTRTGIEPGPESRTEPGAEPGVEPGAESRAGARTGRGRDAVIGVICMDTSFTKIPGHIRNPATFGFPVLYRVVEGATAERVVTRADPGLLGPFVDAARDLQARGAAAVTSGCGFLAVFQRELADAVTVPLYSSSLIQVPMVARMIRSDQKVGLLVADERSLTRRHLAGVGAEDVPVCVAGMEEQPEFREVMLEARRPDLDAARLGREVLGQAGRLARENPDMGALVIECTDLVPYAHAVQERIGLPVFDIVTLTEMVHQGLTRRSYGAPAPAGRGAAR